MASNDQSSRNLPSSFSNLSLRSSRRNARASQVIPAKATNRDSGDDTVNDRPVDRVVKRVRFALSNSQVMREEQKNVSKIERAVPDWEKLPTFSGQCSGVNAVTSSNGSSWSHDRMVRDKNKNLRRIYQEEGLKYGDDVSGAELASRMSRAVALRQASIEKKFKLLNEYQDVQLCFLIDVTGTMEKYIDGVRDSILKIVEKLTEKHFNVFGYSTIAKKVSLAFVGYRNYGLRNPFEFLPFTKSAENFRQFCSKIDAYGAPEDVFGGLEKAIFDLNWTDVSMCTKIIFHITDHPCRAKKYHSSNYPRYRFPDGDPNGRIAETLFDALREKGIQYHFGKITSRTDKIIEVFSEAMGSDIEVFDIKDLDNLVDCVVSSVRIAILNNPRALIAKQYAIKIDRTVPDWHKLPTVSAAEKPFSCKHCERRFADKSNLRAHEQTHDGEKRYACANCGRRFALKSFLSKHEDSSCGQRLGLRALQGASDSNVTAI
ncbi:alpha-protein kinase vwkA [Ditylenchus destructor]|uniref:Alpha-protein kinase vwkA n=1 Tax=Ditylenchus destructor TaxID=166010 RepID=A0AAD4MNB4_9BILA|nr:alpha-protein kinase vwkA [Ditylenchus destructor]